VHGDSLHVYSESCCIFPCLRRIFTGVLIADSAYSVTLANWKMAGFFTSETENKYCMHFGGHGWLALDVFSHDCSVN
jgi:hypothetical protein